MNCLTARQILDLARPDDPHAQPVDDAMQHVEGCATCQRVVHRNGEFDKKMAAMLVDVPLPAGLRERLFERLEAAPVVAASQALPKPSVPARVRSSSRRRWLATAALSAACIVCGLGAWSLWPRGPQYDLDEIVGEVAVNPINPADFPEFSHFAGGLVPTLPATMNTDYLALPMRLHDKDVAVYFFTVPVRRGPPLAGRLVVVPKRVIKGTQVPAAASFLAGTAYKAGFCTTAWVEGDFVYVCCLSGGEAGMRRLLVTQPVAI